MKIVIQRVSKAAVSVSNKIEGQISKGFVILVGITEEDTIEDINWLVKKVLNLRIFEDENQKMNKSLLDVDGELLLISQFTLYASTKKGNRPSFIKAAKPETAIPLYQQLIVNFEAALGKKIQTGIFGADMQVSLINNGPVTLIIDSKDRI